jgi:glutathione S-transferase
VPALADGDLVLTESNTILRYLANREDRDDLYPREARARAKVDGLLDTLSLEVRPALWEAELATLYGRPSGVDWGALLNAALAGFERLLDTSGYACGAFTIADCAIAGRMYKLGSLPIDAAPFPRTLAVVRAATARPAFHRALAATER